MPKSTPVAIAMAAVNPRMRQSGAVEIGCGTSGLTKKPRTIGAVAAAIASPPSAAAAGEQQTFDQELRYQT